VTDRHLATAILRLKCTKFDFGWGSTPYPAGGAYSAPSPLAGFKGPTSKGREGKGREGKEGRDGEGKGEEGKGRKGKEDPRAFPQLQICHTTGAAQLDHSIDPHSITDIEYCSPVWSPSYVTLINKIESVQRFFTKRLNGLQSISYDDRLAMLGLERLELRRLRFDLLMCYKIIYHHVNINRDCFFFNICYLSRH